MNAVIFVVLAMLVLWILLQSGPKKNVKVYGSMECPWTVKQLNNLQGRGEFFDCKNFQCPDFVQGFPTSEKDGQVYVGYREDL